MAMLRNRALTKRIIRSLLIVVALLTLISSVVLAYTYRAAYTITNNSTTSYTMLPVSVYVNNSYLVSNGFIGSTGLDTRIETIGGLQKPWMLTDNSTLTAVVVPASSQTNLYYTTGSSNATSFDIITGYSGNITISDNSTLEIGNNGTVEFSGYIGHTSNVTLVEKHGSFNITDSTTGNVTAYIADGELKNFDMERADTWTGGARSGAQFRDGAYSWLVIGPMGGSATAYQDLPWDNSYRSQFFTFTVWYIGDAAAGRPSSITIDDGPSTNTTTNIAGGWLNLTVTKTLNVAATRLRIILQQNGDGGADRNGYFDQAVISPDYWTTENITVSATGAVAVGSHVVNASASVGANLTISIDSVPMATTALNGNSAANKWNDWILRPTYFDYYKQYVNGVLVAHYQPTDIIHYAGTQGILPDLVAPAEDGLITFGTNPVGGAGGVYVTLGGFVSSSQPAPGSITTDPTRDILPTGGGVDPFLDSSISTQLQANPLRPLITMVSDNTTLTERQVWTYSGIALILLVLMLVATRVRGHHLITGVAVAVVILTLIVQTIFPLYTLLFVAISIFAGIISERARYM